MKYPQGSNERLLHPLLGPVADYLANTKIQSPYFTRYLIFRLLGNLSDGLDPKPQWRAMYRGLAVSAVTIALAGVASYLLRSPSASWPPHYQIYIWLLPICALWNALNKAKDLVTARKVAEIFTGLRGLFSCLHGPADYDGRELTVELREIERLLGLRLPSLLFSLFRIALPGV